MKALFKNDSAVSGVVITLGSEIVAALLVWLGLSLFGSGVDGNLRWFAIAFVSPFCERISFRFVSRAVLAR